MYLIVWYVVIVIRCGYFGCKKCVEVDWMCKCVNARYACQWAVCPCWMCVSVCVYECVIRDTGNNNRNEKKIMLECVSG